MVRYRIFYGCILLSAVAFYLFDTGYVAFILLLTIMLYLPLELLLSLLIRKKIVLQLKAEPCEARIQEKITLYASYQSKLPVSRIKIQVSLENKMTGEQSFYRFRFRNGGDKQEADIKIPCEHCGVLYCETTKVRLIDYAGIFLLPLPKPKPVHLQIFPKTTFYQGNLEGIAQENVLQDFTVKPGEQGERSAVKEYQPGDPIRNMHWKLSSKMMNLMVREAESGYDPSILLAFNFCGTPSQMDNILSKLQGLALALLEYTYSFYLIWNDPDGGLCKYLVGNEKELTDAFHRICSSRLPDNTEDIRTYMQRLDELQAKYLFFIDTDGIHAPGKAGDV